MPAAPAIYLDNNATTRPFPEVVELVSRLWHDGFANPGSPHAQGRRARQILESSRESMAALLGAHPDELVFTSGGTESNNMAIFGLATGSPAMIALTAGEHPAVFEACRFLQGKGWGWRILPVDGDGRLVAGSGLRGGVDSGQGSTGGCTSRDDWGELLDGVRLATVILAHNETGVIQEIGPLAEACRGRGIPLHVDAVQAVGKIPVDFRQLGISTLAFGAHKFHGPRGVGGLLVQRGLALAPVSFGGHQESGRRPGTEVVPLIAGMARALEMFCAEAESRQSRLRQLRDRLEQGLVAQCPPVVVNGSREHRLPNTLNIAFPGVDGEALLIALDLEGIACSLGSACASGAAEPAPVLVAMNRPREVLKSSVRFSVGVENTLDEIEAAVGIVARTVKRLRAAAG